MTNNDYIKINNQIKMRCPYVKKFIQVSDDWYPSYVRDGKLFVECIIHACYDKFKDAYFAHIIFWGADDFGLEKYCCSNDLKEIINKYRDFRKYSEKLPRNRNLQDILYRDGFKPF